MFGKLVKYELRYLIRIFAPMWAAVLALCLLSRLTVQPDFIYNAEELEQFLPALVLMVTMFAIMTVMIVSMVVLLQRFYKGMYGDEGYLMFTLPVTTGSLINSKGLSAMIMLIATELVTFLGIFIMMSYPELWFGEMNMGDVSFTNLWEQFLYLTDMTTGEVLLLAFWGLIAFLLTTAAGIYLIYLSISLGQLWKKHPVAGAVVAYYAINIAVSLIEGMLGFDMQQSLMENDMLYRNAVMLMLGYTTVEGLLTLGVSFFGTKIILDKKLNIA